MSEINDLLRQLDESVTYLDEKEYYDLDYYDHQKRAVEIKDKLLAICKIGLPEQANLPRLNAIATDLGFEIKDFGDTGRGFHEGYGIYRIASYDSSAYANVRTLEQVYWFLKGIAVGGIAKIEQMNDLNDKQIQALRHKVLDLHNLL